MSIEFFHALNLGERHMVAVLVTMARLIQTRDDTLCVLNNNNQNLQSEFTMQQDLFGDSLLTKIVSLNLI